VAVLETAVGSAVENAAACQLPPVSEGRGGYRAKWSGTCALNAAARADGHLQDERAGSCTPGGEGGRSVMQGGVVDQE